MDMKWKLKDILMVAIVGVLFSFLFLGADYVGAALKQTSEKPWL